MREAVPETEMVENFAAKEIAVMFLSRVGKPIGLASTRTSYKITCQGARMICCDATL